MSAVENPLFSIDSSSAGTSVGSQCVVHPARDFRGLAPHFFPMDGNGFTENNYKRTFSQDVGVILRDEDLSKTKEEAGSLILSVGKMSASQ
jgi:hypothetical protein